MHTSIWVFLDGHDAQRASFEWGILLFREMKPRVLQEQLLVLSTPVDKEPLPAALSTRNAPWTWVLPTRPRVTKLCLRKITQLEHTSVSAFGEWEDTEYLPKRKFCHFWISASKQNKKAAFLNFLLISQKPQGKKIWTVQPNVIIHSNRWTYVQK